MQELAGRVGTVSDSPTPEQMQLMLEWMRQQDPATLRRFAGLAIARKYEFEPPDELTGTTDLTAQRKVLNELLQQGKLFAYFVLGKDPATTLEDFEYVSNNLTDSGLREWYESTATGTCPSSPSRRARPSAATWPSTSRASRRCTSRPQG